MIYYCVFYMTHDCGKEPRQIQRQVGGFKPFHNDSRRNRKKERSITLMILDKDKDLVSTYSIYSICSELLRIHCYWILNSDWSDVGNEFSVTVDTETEAWASVCLF